MQNSKFQLSERQSAHFLMSRGVQQAQQGSIQAALAAGNGPSRGGAAGGGLPGSMEQQMNTFIQMMDRDHLWKQELAKDLKAVKQFSGSVLDQVSAVSKLQKVLHSPALLLYASIALCFPLAFLYHYLRFVSKTLCDMCTIPRQLIRMCQHCVRNCRRCSNHSPTTSLPLTWGYKTW